MLKVAPPAGHVFHSLVLRHNLFSRTVTLDVGLEITANRVEKDDFACRPDDHGKTAFVLADRNSIPTLYDLNIPPR